MPVPHPHVNLEDLYRRTLKGEATEDALFAEVHYIIARRIRSWLGWQYAYLCKYMLPEDLVQACLIHVWKSWRKHDPSMPFRRFIRLKTDSMARDLRRHIKRKDRAEIPRPLHEETDYDSAQLSPLDRLLRQEALDMLDGKYACRRLMEIHFVDRVPYRRLARALNTSKSTVAAKVARQIKHARKQLELK